MRFSVAEREGRYDGIVAQKTIRDVFPLKYWCSGKKHMGFCSAILHRFTDGASYIFIEFFVLNIGVLFCVTDENRQSSKGEKLLDSLKCFR